MVVDTLKTFSCQVLASVNVNFLQIVDDKIQYEGVEKYN